METFFLQCIWAVSESRHWLLPLLVFCAAAILLLVEIRDSQRELDRLIEEMTDFDSFVRRYQHDRPYHGGAPVARPRI